MKKVLFPLLRFYANLRRNSKAKSLLLMQRRGETPDSFIIREATIADIPQLSVVHVKAWADTYFTTKKPPTYEIRSWQWQEAFAKQDGSWFCYVAENKEGNIIGFAKGKTYSHENLPDYSGELNKIYLLFEYHRLGIGTKMLCYTARRFLSMNIRNMVLFSEAANPTGWFYEALGAKKLYSDKNEFHGGYAWDDLEGLATVCGG